MNSVCEFPSNLTFVDTIYSTHASTQAASVCAGQDWKVFLSKTSYAGRCATDMVHNTRAGVKDVFEFKDSLANLGRPEIALVRHAGCIHAIRVWFVIPKPAEGLRNCFEKI